MSSKTNRFARTMGTKRYKKLFVLAVEGSETEPQYFALFNQTQDKILIKCLTGKSAPLHILKRMKDYLKNNVLESSDEAWLVVDRDSWEERHLNELFKWSRENVNYHLALSNPKIEYWLLLHFEDGTSITNSQLCDQRLKKHLPEYYDSQNKKISSSRFNQEMIRKAIERAKNRDIPPCTDWPRSTNTTVYKLVERILSASFNNNMESNKA